MTQLNELLEQMNKRASDLERLNTYQEGDEFKTTLNELHKAITISVVYRTDIPKLIAALELAIACESLHDPNIDCFMCERRKKIQKILSGEA